jgi:hypothetical protein
LGFALDLLLSLFKLLATFLSGALKNLGIT